MVTTVATRERSPATRDRSDDPLGLAASRRRTTAWLLCLALGLLVSAVAGLAIGAFAVPGGTVARVVAHHLVGWPEEQTWSAPVDAIVWQVRLPRVLLGALVGAGLAICGVALQAMVRNVLADPYLLGVNSGASSGAAAAILFGVGAGWVDHALQVTAFLGALAASLLVFLVARSGGRVTSVRLLLAGVAVGYALYALTSFLIFASGSAEGARSVMFWLLGSLALATWDLPLAVVAAVVAGRHGAADRVGSSARCAGRRRRDRPHARRIARTGSACVLLVVVALCVGVVVSAAGQHRLRRPRRAPPGTAGRRLVPTCGVVGRRPR